MVKIIIKKNYSAFIMFGSVIELHSTLSSYVVKAPVKLPPKSIVLLVV